MVFSLPGTARRARLPDPEGQDGRPAKSEGPGLALKSEQRPPPPQCEAASRSESATAAQGAAGRTGRHARAPRHDYTAPAVSRPVEQHLPRAGPVTTADNSFRPRTESRRAPPVAAARAAERLTLKL